MLYWTRDEIMAGAELPDELEELVGAVAECIRDGGKPFPRIARVGAREERDELKEFVYEIDVELAPGLILPSYCGHVELIEMGFDVHHVEAFLDTVMEGIPICLAEPTRLSDLAHDLRMRARRAVAAQNAAGLSTRLIDVTLAPYDHWRGQAEPVFLLHLEGLGPGLVPTRWDLSIENVDELDEDLDRWRAHFAKRSNARTELLSLGASGRISQLALNAIAHHGDVAGSLQRFASETRFWLPDKTALLFQDGSVAAANGDLSGNFQWNTDGFAVSGEFISAGILAAAVGGPVTDLMDHPFLSADMVVTAATNVSVNGEPVLKIVLDMPKRLFCTASGRVWDEPVAKAPADPMSSDRVVAFRRPGT